MPLSSATTLLRHAGEHRRRVAGGAADVEHVIVIPDVGKLQQLRQHARRQQPAALGARGGVTGTASSM